MKVITFLKKIFSPYLWLNFIAMAALIVLLAWGVKNGLDLYTHHGESIQVPNVVGKKLADAQKLIDAKGLVIEVSDSGYNKKKPANTVLAQYPDNSARVKSGHVIYVTINSLHSPTLVMPDVVDNSSFREAEAKLSSMGFKLLQPQLVHGEKDWVYGIVCRGKKVYAGDRVPIDQGITLQIGDGTFDGATMDVDYTDPLPGLERDDDYIPQDNSQENNNSSEEDDNTDEVKETDEIEEPAETNTPQPAQVSPVQTAPAKQTTPKPTASATAKPAATAKATTTAKPAAAKPAAATPKPASTSKQASTSKSASTAKTSKQFAGAPAEH